MIILIICVKNNQSKFKPTTKILRRNDMCRILEEIGGLTAKQLLKKYGISLTPPINLAKLIENIGISSYSFDFGQAEELGGFKKGDIIGATLSTGNDLDILYAKGLRDNGIRFTVAHELGHCCLHTENLSMEHIQLRTESDKDSEEERNANIFAGELLIPKESLDYVCGSLLRPKMSTLVHIFQVSANVMRARLKYLGRTVIDDIPNNSTALMED